MTDDGAAGRADKNTVKGNRSFGSAHRSTIIHGDNNIIYPSPDSDDGDEDAAEEEPAPASHPFPWKLIGGAVVAIIIIFNIIPGPPEPKSSFPAENGTRPAGSNDLAVLAAALDGLQSCAKALVLQPQNCPQQVKDWAASDATTVTWRIHGVPGDGAVIHYNGEEGRFHVLGTAVMTASYVTASGPALKLRVIQFWARVEWAAGKAKLAELRNYDDTPRPVTEKRNPQVPDELALSLVKAAFERCVKTKKSRLPPECPDTYSGAGSSRVSWKLNGDPSINAKPRFEPSTGLIHVEGDYSVTASYSQLFFGATSEPASGRYDAVLSVDDGKPQVLRISTV
ncbi:hypothetical protein O7607_00305 [Micromonospora sp. WMMA1949]|uniref:hypothetical protein n=1 Tax=Micromonospora sp. WMMA1949 TaxID=3015162 RepID=UPI0022B69B09|nr:hypothetical protein [Micromonospora sp. WMMA1949]MCZ7424160.1 hypothetical protein [Micromonospora sp. WMMA1949]